MKRFLIIALALILTLPAFAQVGRYKDIKVLYPGYTLKFDTAKRPNSLLFATITTKTKFSRK